MAKNINEGVFDEATKLKLSIFGECFKEWFPVFNNNPSISKIFIFDFFAGSGMDIEKYPGSPLVLFDIAKGKDKIYCKNSKKETVFFFNDDKKKKSIELKENVNQFIEKCKIENNCENCVYKFTVQNYGFKEIFENLKIKNVFLDKNFGKFVLLDQYGFKEIDNDIFKQLISFPKTDFIFFISSSFISRFREHENTKRYIDTEKIKFDEIKPNEIHRAIAKYFYDLIPEEKEFYLHHFSIQKEENKGNYYGLIFGTNHSLGMEKFLKVCWQKDSSSGEASYNIDNNFAGDTLFGSLSPYKMTMVKNEIKKLILNGYVKDNISGFKLAMKKGCEPKIFTDIVKGLEKEGKISRGENKNYASTNIHKIKKYSIHLLK